MKLCIALDLEKKSQNLSLLKSIKHLDIWVKVGLRSFIRDGYGLIEDIRNINENFKIFLDLKLYDIPNTMIDSTLECAKIGVNMITIHTSSGERAMRGIMESLKSLPKPPLIMGVTALTSFDNEEFENIYNSPIKNHAINLAKIAFKSGIDGVVCSVYESLDIKEATLHSFLTLTPGIRPFGENNNDQKRVADIQMAKESLSDFIVIGRPIYQSSDPTATTEKILKML